MNDETGFHIIWGMWRVNPFGPHPSWTPNYALKMTAREQYEANKRAGIECKALNGKDWLEVCDE